jgi:hypothetical protein
MSYLVELKIKSLPYQMSNKRRKIKFIIWFMKIKNAVNLMIYRIFIKMYSVLRVLSFKRLLVFS